MIVERLQPPQTLGLSSTNPQESIRKPESPFGCFEQLHFLNYLLVKAKSLTTNQLERLEQIIKENDENGATSTLEEDAQKAGIIKVEPNSKPDEILSIVSFSFSPMPQNPNSNHLLAQMQQLKNIGLATEIGSNGLQAFVSTEHGKIWAEELKFNISGKKDSLQYGQILVVKKDSFENSILTPNHT